jgi:hypothetical protein
VNQRCRNDFLDKKLPLVSVQNDLVLGQKNMYHTNAKTQTTVIVIVSKLSRTYYFRSYSRQAYISPAGYSSFKYFKSSIIKYSWRVEIIIHITY